MPVNDSMATTEHQRAKRSDEKSADEAIFHLKNVLLLAKPMLWCI